MCSPWMNFSLCGLKSRAVWPRFEETTLPGDATGEVTSKGVRVALQKHWNLLKNTFGGCVWGGGDGDRLMVRTF